jgi:hypothetical protein
MADPNTQATKQPDTETETKSQPGSLPALPALPAVGDGEARTLEVGGAALRLDHMGPMVVNEDGTLSRIANWDKMAEIEQTNALRICKSSLSSLTSLTCLLLL